MKYTSVAILFLLFFFPASLFAQTNYSVKGSIADDFSSLKLVNSTVLVLNAKDSIMRKFTRTGADGSFAINHLSKGSFILLISYPGYADYVEPFALDSLAPVHDFKTLGLKLKSRILQDVIIKGKAAAIKIKGDTTEFNAAAFNIQPNSKVEDLLRQLPGIKVDKDGKITAQGQSVPKVLVDGEEFFGDDPTLVTKNIRADMVDKVQLYDKKSDQATFTGIDDGQKTKTINIKLKEDKKNGYFGKVDAGVATDKYYSGQLLYNKFKGKTKFSAYGTLSNTGKTGLGWQDSQKYASSDNVTVSDDGGLYFSGSYGGDLDSFNGQFNGQGIPTARTGGLHYDTKWNSDKESLNANYKIGSISIDGTSNTLTQNNLPSGTINTNSNNTFHNFMFRQKLDGTFSVKLDTTSTLKLMADITPSHTETVNNYNSVSRRANDTLLNTNNRSLNNKVDGIVLNASAFYTKKFKKTGRTLSFNATEAYNESDAKGYLKSQINYYGQTGVMDSSQVVDQYKTTKLRSSVLTTNLTYTEPFSKQVSLVLNYGVSINNSTADRRSYNRSADGQYNLLDTVYSNDYRLNQFASKGGAVFNYKSGKTTINVGTQVSEVNFNQTNLYNGNVFKRNFVNWNPQAMYQYRFTQQSSFRVNYYGSTVQPTVDQIQPVLVNNDPLNVVLGNPGLNPSFTSRFNLQYNTYKVLSDQSIFVYGGTSFTSNPIVSSVATDSSGKSTNRYVNLNRVPYNFNLGVYLSRKIAGPDINMGIDLGANGSKSYSISNGLIDTITLNTYNVGVNISKYVQKKYDFYLSTGPTYTVGGASLQKGINNNGHGWQGDAGFEVYLPGKVQVSSNANYQYNSKTQTFDQSFSRVLLNASISKAFFKAENLKLVLSGNDLLNQNAGFNRSVNGNLISQNTYTTIKRYYMLSIVWDFNKMGGTAKK